MSDKDAMAEYKAAKAKAKALRPWYKKKRVWILAFLIFSAIAGATSKHGATYPVSTGSQTVSTSTNSTSSTSGSTTTDKTSATTESAGEKNARETAGNYLQNEAFSRTGLIKQLEFEGYSASDSAYGVDSQNADWSKEAAASAKNYLSNEAFSHSGLVAQLKYEGFTTAQAEYGVSVAGL